MRRAWLALAFAAALAPLDARASCVGKVAEQTAAALGAVPNGALVVAAPLESDVAPAGDRGAELALRVASLVAGKLAGAHVSPRTASLDDARALAARASRLVYVRTRVEKSELRVTVDAYPTVRNVWDRARLPPPPPTGHAYAAAPIDAEVRAFYPPIPLALDKVVTRATGAPANVLAAACGDLDGDGAPELLLVARDRVVLARIRGGRVDVARSVAWSALRKWAPVPLREPLAGAAIEIGAALVGTSDRGTVALGDALDAPRALEGGLPIGAGLCAPISTERLAFEGTESGCGTVPPMGGEAIPFDAAAALDVVAPNGSERLALATSHDGKLVVRIDGAEKATFEGAGAQVALFDADLDGIPEVAFASDASPGAPDSIEIATLPAGAPRVVGRIAAPAGVRALAACPPTDGASGTLVAVVGSEVWLVR